MSEIRNAVTVVTGATQGIGRALVTALARRGARLALVAREREALEQLQKLLKTQGVNSFACPADVGDSAQVEQMMESIHNRFGAIDIVINNAGVGLFQPIAEARLPDIETVLRTNFYGTLYCTLEALRYMRSSHRGLIVNVSSAIGKHAVYHQGIYAASKAAVDRMTEALQAEEAQNGIKTLLVIPDRTATNFRDHVVGDRRLAVLPGPRMRELSPDTVAEGIVKAIARDKAVP